MVKIAWFFKGLVVWRW